MEATRSGLPTRRSPTSARAPQRPRPAWHRQGARRTSIPRCSAMVTARTGSAGPGPMSVRMLSASRSAWALKPRRTAVVLLGDERGLHVLQHPGEQITRARFERRRRLKVDGQLVVATGEDTVQVRDDPDDLAGGAFGERGGGQQ